MIYLTHYLEKPLAVYSLNVLKWVNHFEQFFTVGQTGWNSEWRPPSLFPEALTSVLSRVFHIGKTYLYCSSIKLHNVDIVLVLQHHLKPFFVAVHLYCRVVTRCYFTLYICVRSYFQTLLYTNNVVRLTDGHWSSIYNSNFLVPPPPFLQSACECSPVHAFSQHQQMQAVKFSIPCNDDIRQLLWRQVPSCLLATGGWQLLALVPPLLNT